MDLILERIQYTKDGIFSELFDEKYQHICFTLEHAYPTAQGLYIAKIYPGEFVCKRGVHELQGMSAPFETFEITGVEGHTNLLFHAGNFNSDSEGCILLGDSITDVKMVTNSRATFAKFMELQIGVSEFMLTVEM